MRNLRLLLWTYLFLLIFEGALRKWIVPALDAPLLVIRDPLVLWIYYEAFRNRLRFNNAFFIPTIVLTVSTAFFSTVAGFGTPFITAYGVHADFLQLPLIFLMPQIFNREDVVQVGRVIFYVAIPMALLVIYQFRSSPDSLINKGAFVTWYGTVRPSGTFSFISGPVAFFPLCASFIFYGFLRPRTYPLWLMGSVVFAVLLAGACSGSRSILVATAIVVVVAVLCVAVRGGQGAGGMIGGAIGLALLIPVLSTLSVVQDGTKQLSQRIADGAAAGEDTEGFVGRYVNTMAGPIYIMGNSPLFGNGLGLGTNAAAGLLTGKREFLGAEDEWGRLIFECGPIFGLLLILLRIALTATLLKCAYDALRQNNFLPMLILAACGVLVLNGQWGVPTSLGFAIYGAGLTLAACVEPEEDDEEEEQDNDGEEHDDHDAHEDEPSEDEPDHTPARDRVA